jgi:hypothetical protein
MEQPDSDGAMSRRALIRTGAAAGAGAAGFTALAAGPAMTGSRGRGTRRPLAPDHWTAPGEQIVFEPSDFDILDLTLHVIPDLRICALAVKLARSAGIRYPITDRATICDLLPAKRFTAAGHRITAAAINDYVPVEFFPINHPGELAERLYMALLRCRADTSAASVRRMSPGR